MDGVTPGMASRYINLYISEITLKPVGGGVVGVALDEEYLGIYLLLLITIRWALITSAQVYRTPEPAGL